MAKMEKRYAFQVGGRDYSARITWGSHSETGEVYVNDREVHRWNPYGFGFKVTRFTFDGFHAEVRRASPTGAFSSVTDVELYIEGRPANQLPQPTFLQQYVERSRSVSHTQPAPCPKCHEGATMLVYDTGAVEVVCASCGRSVL